MAQKLNAPHSNQDWERQWLKACRHLSRQDKVLAEVIRQQKGRSLQARDNAFVSLARAIVGQQISVKAAASIWAQLMKKVAMKAAKEVDGASEAELDIGKLSRMRIPSLRACGLSERKAEYIRDLAKNFVSETIDPLRWPQMSDEEIILELSMQRGIGRWTAEMFLIFNLRRMNVLPLDDVGVLRAMGNLYGQGDKFSREQATALGDRWQPYRTVATWHLWRSLDGVPT